MMIIMGVIGVIFIGIIFCEFPIITIYYYFNRISGYISVFIWRF